MLTHPLIEINSHRDYKRPYPSSGLGNRLQEVYSLQSKRSRVNFYIKYRHGAIVNVGVKLIALGYSFVGA